MGCKDALQGSGRPWMVVHMCIWVFSWGEGAVIFFGSQWDL